MILLINNSANSDTEKYKLFYDSQDATDYANSLSNIENCDIKFINIQPEPSKPKINKYDMLGFDGC